MANYDCLSPFIRSSFDAYDRLHEEKYAFRKNQTVHKPV